ncbi:OmpH family outer membrane protein [Opitutus sp. GAS368]|jgi:outer membrane protein|uniref:OmpH family outer membrane protein n=1 Tax=Opitutus sp. GAS368 TaxID=1882749 RepID=UPI00087AAA0E|nr:OmpH family outer membrane protein [Opitutus sp. GAS368]SDS31205.1 periplasmic chaperone for outer membrane proteins Skp [Opitutus sp. GAS368]
MNKMMIRTFLLLAACATGTTALLAQPALKLVTVDMAKAYDTYYKSEDAMAKFNDARQKAQEQGEELRKQGQTMVEEYKELAEQAKSTLLNPEAKAKAEQARDKKMEDIQRKQGELQNFVQTTDRQLQQQMLTRREMLLDEISKVVTDLAKRKGATLVIDKSGPSAFRIPIVLYADAGYEITDDVVAELNKDRPPAAPVAPAPAKPAAATPAPASPAPGFTVPNVSKPADPAKKP